MATLQSVNIAVPRPIPTKAGMTGIYKEPVSGDVAVSAAGLAGDAIMDHKHHGGPDQAAYLYFADDYDWWAGELGRALAPGSFGENLTIAGVEGRTVAVGDRFAVGAVVLEVTCHRTPCSVFAARMGDPGWVRRFQRAGRPGAYCRVIEPGAVGSGAEVRHTRFAGDGVTVAELMAQNGVRDIDPAFLRRALAAPVHHKMRADYEARLAAATATATATATAKE